MKKKMVVRKPRKKLKFNFKAHISRVSKACKKTDRTNDLIRVISPSTARKIVVR